MCNYKKEEIPDFEHEIEDFKTRSLSDFKQYSFSELDSLREKQDKPVIGVYVLYNKSEPVYVGISRNILNRIKQHFTGTSPSQSSLVYLIARTEQQDFVTFRDDFQKHMRKDWSFSMIPEENPYTKYLMEIYIACKLETKWNSFETH
jgi:predicted GIY-YIG superfamily endonuclease